jgi:hypothetical protein
MESPPSRCARFSLTSDGTTGYQKYYMDSTAGEGMHRPKEKNRAGIPIAGIPGGRVEKIFNMITDYKALF